MAGAVPVPTPEPVSSEDFLAALRGLGDGSASPAPAITSPASAATPLPIPAASPLPTLGVEDLPAAPSADDTGSIVFGPPSGSVPPISFGAPVPPPTVPPPTLTTPPQDQ